MCQNEKASENGMQGSSRQMSAPQMITTTSSMRSWVAKLEKASFFYKIWHFQKNLTFSKNEKSRKYMVFPTDFESVLRIHCRKIRKMRRDMVAAAEGRCHRVSSHFSYLSPVNFEKWFQVIGKDNMFLLLWLEQIEKLPSRHCFWSL